MLQSNTRVYIIAQPQIDTSFRHFNLLHIVEWRGSKCRLQVCKMAKISDFCPTNSAGEAYKQTMACSIPKQCLVWKFRENCARVVEKSAVENKRNKKK